MVSIIILVQDRYDIFKRCLDSVIQFTSTPCEIILILQGVTDTRIKQYINSVENINPNLAFILADNPINTGVTPGRNQGMLMSTGDYILFLDDDAYITNNMPDIEEGYTEYDWIERMVSEFNKPDVGIVSQSGSYINPSTPGIFWACNVRHCECDVGQGYCFMFSKKVFEKIGLLDEYFGKFWHEESEYALRAKYNGFKVINCGYIGVTHYGSNSGDDGTYGLKINYMFNKWSPYFDTILVKRDKWNVKDS